jgi:transcriptional regulator with PAS, ATPase and Fis domain
MDAPSAFRDRPAPALLGTHPDLARALAVAERLARTDQPLLLVGETGTGKDLVARRVHRSSPRAEGPFRAVNCASLAPGILEGELFGAARGAYTGAEADRPGLLEAAHGGTLFLDEVGDMPPALQAALLRVLEDGVTRRLGEAEDRRTDFRLVTATHRDLDALVAEGRFRADLRYRLGRSVRLPPLRERGDDAILLARAFLAEAAGGSPPLRLDPEAEAWLRVHRFPGNVRELRSRVLAAAALAEGDSVGAADLAGDDAGTAAPGDPPEGGEADRAALLLEAVRHLGPVPVGGLVRATGLPRRTVQRALAGLVRGGGLVREGRGPSTRYAPPG